MVFKIERRLDFFIVFRSYCEWMFKRRRAEDGADRAEVSFEKPIDFFFYSRWKKDDDIREAFGRLNTKKQQQGISFDVHGSDAETHVSIKIKRESLEAFIAGYLSKIKRSVALSHADEENPYECNKVLAFNEQENGLMNLLLRYYFSYGTVTEIQRFDLGEIEPKIPYQRYCFEELLLVLQEKGFIVINDVYAKELTDPDRGQLMWVPVVKIEYKSTVTCGRLAYDRHKNAILLDGRVEVPTRPESKTAINSISINFLRILIIANGNFVSSKELEREMTRGLSTKGKGYTAKVVFHRLKESHPNIAEFIESDRARKNSKGYQIRRG